MLVITIILEGAILALPGIPIEQKAGRALLYLLSTVLASVAYCAGVVFSVINIRKYLLVQAGSDQLSVAGRRRKRRAMGRSFASNEHGCGDCRDGCWRC